MALDILVTTDRISRDPVGRDFIEFARSKASELHLSDAALYYDFPTYSDYETVAHKPDILLVSKKHGIVAIRFITGADMPPLSSVAIEVIDESLGQFCSILIGRLLKSRDLRKSLSQLKFSVLPVLFHPGTARDFPELSYSRAISSHDGFKQLDTRKNPPISGALMGSVQCLPDDRLRAA